MPTDGGTSLASVASATSDVLRRRARRRFALLFEEELRATVADDADFANDWRALSRHTP